MANDGAKNAVSEIVQDALQDLEDGHIEIDALPDDMQKHVLDGTPIEVPDDEDPTEGKPAPANGTKPGQGKTPEELWEERNKALAEANKWQQKFEAKDRLLTKLATDKDFAIQHLKSKGMDLVHGEDPRITARIAEASTPLPAQPESDTLQKQFNTAIDAEIRQLDSGLAEDFSVLDERWGKIFYSFADPVTGQVDQTAARRYVDDPEYRKQVHVAINVPEIPDLPKYLEMTALVKQWQSLPKAVPLADYLALFGHGKRKPAAAPSGQKPQAPSQPARRADEVPILPMGQGDPAPSTTDLARKYDDIIARYERDPSSITKEEKKFIMDQLD